ncbi:MAG: GNAT family N-acetyltransferase [Planctomycetota bacterium]|jgi:RimJ/RimL family protein N-acetyltransferase
MEYRTERLVIRPETVDDEEFCVALWTDPEVTRYVGGPRDPEVVRKAFRASADPGWTVLDESGPVGEVFFVQKEVEGRAEQEVVYVFSREVWGRGYAAEAAAPLIADRERLVALIHPENLASRRVAEKLGFRFEKRIPRGEKKLDLFVR